MNQVDLDAVLDRTPELGAWGFRCDCDDTSFEQSRDNLRGRLEEAQLSVEWLQTPHFMYPVLGLSHHKQWINSYALKHFAEDAVGHYIPNGVLIAAAIYLDLPMKDRDGPNVMIKIPVRSK